MQEFPPKTCVTASEVWRTTSMHMNEHFYKEGTNYRSAKQFNIYYGHDGSSKYEPDFVVETAGTIYMVETKASSEIGSDAVKEKAVAAQEYCRAVTEWNAQNGGKPWEYALISHDEVRLQSSFMYLVKNRAATEQLFPWTGEENPCNFTSTK